MPQIIRLTKGQFDLCHIETISLLVLKLLNLLESDNIFKIQMIEQILQLKTKYLSDIDKPIDFLSIEDHRLSSYNDISELQDDLILVFKNCCMYTQVGSYYWEYSKNIWKSLPTIFEQALKIHD